MVDVDHHAYLLVERYAGPDRLRVTGEHGEVILDVPMHPAGPLAPENAAAARDRPWFYTMSPFGGQIVGLAWERHAAGRTIA